VTNLYHDSSVETGRLRLLLTSIVIGRVDKSALTFESLPDIKATPAYEMLIVKRAAVWGELIEQKETLTSQHPDVERTHYELSLLNIEIEKMQDAIRVFTVPLPTVVILGVFFSIVSAFLARRERPFVWLWMGFLDRYLIPAVCGTA
jgi:hypothetical protein